MTALTLHLFLRIGVVCTMNIQAPLVSLTCKFTVCSLYILRVKDTITSRTEASGHMLPCIIQYGDHLHATL